MFGPLEFLAVVGRLHSTAILSWMQCDVVCCCGFVALIGGGLVQGSGRLVAQAALTSLMWLGVAGDFTFPPAGSQVCTLPPHLPMIKSYQYIVCVLED